MTKNFFYTGSNIYNALPGIANGYVTTTQLYVFLYFIVRRDENKCIISSRFFLNSLHLELVITKLYLRFKKS